jgi:hypothetical protein
MRAAVAACPTPEHVNDGADTAPSKRLERWSGKAYDKVGAGLEIARLIGIDSMRSACPHFDQWVCWLLDPEGGLSGSRREPSGPPKDAGNPYPER